MRWLALSLAGGVFILACACSSTSKNQGNAGGSAGAGAGGSAGSGTGGSAGSGAGGSAGGGMGGAAGSAPCDLAADFEPPKEVTELNDLAGGAVRAWLSEEQTTIYFASLVGAAHDLWRGTRSKPEDPFTDLAALANVNDLTAPDYAPSVTKDGQTLFFTSLRSGDNQLYRATRADGGADFGSPKLVENVNSAADDGMAAVSGNGSLLVFRSNVANPGTIDFDLYEAVDNGQGFGSPEPVELLNSKFYESFPALRSDGRELYYSTTRPEGSQGGAEIWTASRKQATDPWSPPEIVPALNSADDDYSSWISPDGCTIYLHRVLGTNESKIYVASRPK